MKLSELLFLVDQCCNDFAFNVDGKASGIFPEAHRGKKVYHLCYGDEEKDVFSADEVVNVEFFGGKALKEICESVDFFVS